MNDCFCLLVRKKKKPKRGFFGISIQCARVCVLKIVAAIAKFLFFLLILLCYLGGKKMRRLECNRKKIIDSGEWPTFRYKTSTCLLFGGMSV